MKPTVPSPSAGAGVCRPWTITLALLVSLCMNAGLLLLGGAPLVPPRHEPQIERVEIVAPAPLVPAVTREEVLEMLRDQDTRLRAGFREAAKELAPQHTTATPLPPPTNGEQHASAGIHLVPCPDIDQDLFDVAEVSKAIVERFKFMGFVGKSAETEKLRFHDLWPVPYRFETMGPVFPTVCKHLEAYGKGDDEKRFCVNEAMTKPGCTVLSIGSANQWGFEQDIAKRTPCKIITADCTMKVAANPPAEIRDRVTFYPLCLGSETRDNFRTYWDFLKEVKVDSPTFLKMDIEGGEWPVLLSIVQESVKAAREGKNIFPVQMAVEVHDHSNWEPVSPQSMYAFFNDLFTRAGYLMAQAKANPFCIQCNEVLFVRVVCGGAV